jgi:hypothetical protein
MAARYQIILDNTIAPGRDAQEVKKHLSGLFKADTTTIERLFAARPTVLKKNVDYQTAVKYKQAIEQTGATCRVEPMRGGPGTRHSPQDRIPKKSVPRRLMMCPKCGFEQENAPRCARCGTAIKTERAKKPQEQIVHSESPKVSPYVLARHKHFRQEEFRITDSGGSPDVPFVLAASKVRFDFVGAPTFLEEFFIFQEFDQLETASLEEFTAAAWKWALTHENPLPPSAHLTKSAFKFLGPTFQRLEHNTSVREFSVVVCLYAVAVAARVRSEALDWVHAKESAHYEQEGKQAGFVVPLVFDGREGGIHYFRKAPFRARAFYSEAKKVIRRHLIP